LRFLFFPSSSDLVSPLFFSPLLFSPFSSPSSLSSLLSLKLFFVKKELWVTLSLSLS